MYHIRRTKASRKVFAGRTSLSPAADQRPEEADAIELAVDAVLAAGWRTADIAKPGEKTVGTREMGRLIREKLAAR